MIKVFLSHQKHDAPRAQLIRDRLLAYHQIDSYLDVIDPYLNSSGDELAAHIRSEIGKCTHLIAVTSFATKISQWVPWEIGIATEKRYPLATYADYTSAIPEFLEAWPYLRSLSDIDKYAEAAKARYRDKQTAKSLTESLEMRNSEFNGFFIDLRQRLGQPIARAR